MDTDSLSVWRNMTTEEQVAQETVHPEEFPGAMVVDSEGYIYGKTRKPEIRPDRIVLEVYKERSVDESYPDITALKSILLSAVRKTFGKPTMQDLYAQIRKETGKSEFTDENLIEYAKRKGIPVPMIKGSKNLEEKKGTVESADIDAIGKTDLGICILLKRPLEAAQRGLKPAKIVPFRPYHELGPKMVVDARAKILGYAADMFLNSLGEPQIKLKKKGAVEQEIPDTQALENFLLSHGEKRDRLYKVVADSFHLKQVTPQHLVTWAQQQGYHIPMKKSLESKELEFQYLLPWKAIRKIGDVVILDSPIETA